MNQKIKEFLKTKNDTTQTSYRRGLELFEKYTEKEYSENLAGQKLIKKVAKDRRKKIENRERPEIGILKGFFNWLSTEAKNGSGYSSKTAHVYLSGVIEFLNYNDLPIEKKKLSLSKPTRKKNNRKMNIRPKEIERMVNHAKTNRDKAVILSLWQSGMSISDLLGLNIGDVKPEDEVRGSLNNPPLMLKLVRKKSSVDYRTFLGGDACRALKKYLAERERTVGGFDRGDPLFLQQRKNGDKNYQRLTKAAAEMMFRRIAKRSGLVSEERLEEADYNPARPHALRAGFSSVLKEEGVNQSLIDGLTGHSVGYDSAYHNFTDRQLRELYQEHEEALSIGSVSMPKEKEIEEVIEQKFGEVGADKVMPELKEKVNSQSDRLEKIEKENRELKEKLSMFDSLIKSQMIDQLKTQARFNSIEQLDYLNKLDFFEFKELGEVDENIDEEFPDAPNMGGEDKKYWQPDEDKIKKMSLDQIEKILSKLKQKQKRRDEIIELAESKGIYL